MTPHRTFTNPEPPDGADAPEGVSFDLEGTTRTGKKWQVQGLRTYPQFPEGLLVEIPNVVGVRDGVEVYQRQALIRSLRGVLEPGSRRRFDALIADGERQVRLQLLGEVWLWLVEELLGRPTGPQPGSPAGAADTPATSEAG